MAVHLRLSGCTKAISLPDSLRTNNKGVFPARQLNRKLRLRPVLLGQDGVSVGKAKHPVPTDAVPSIGAPPPRVHAWRKLHFKALMLLSIVSEFHPSLFELTGGHPDPVVRYTNQPTEIGRYINVHFRCSGIPCVCY